MMTVKTSKRVKSNHFSTTTERFILRLLASGGKTANQILIAFYEARGTLLLGGNFYGYIKGLLKDGLIEKIKEERTNTQFYLTKEGEKATLENAKQELADAQKTIAFLRR